MKGRMEGQDGDSSAENEAATGMTISLPGVLMQSHPGFNYQYFRRQANHVDVDATCAPRPPSPPRL